MKRMCWIVISFVLVIVHHCAYAESYLTYGTENVPDEIKAYLENSPWKDWEITGYVNPSGIQIEDACAFVAVKQDRANNLLAFGADHGKWKYLWHSTTALPQVIEPVLLADVSGLSDQRIGFTSYYIYNYEIAEAFCTWVLEDDQTWHLNTLEHYYPLMFFDTSAENAMHIYNTGWVSEETDIWLFGSFQADLRSFDFSAFPTTVEDAMDYIDLAYLSELAMKGLNPENVVFPKGEIHRVYQGPGEEYGQAGHGKAIVSTNDWIQVFGIYQDWLLVQYEISEGHLRIGWITADALSDNAGVEALAFTSIPVSLSAETVLTDDPFYSREQMAVLQKGTAAHWLATYEGDEDRWAYIRCDTQPPMFGFVPIDVLSVTLDASE